MANKDSEDIRSPLASLNAKESLRLTPWNDALGSKTPTCASAWACTPSKTPWKLSGKTQVLLSVLIHTQPITQPWCEGAACAAEDSRCKTSSKDTDSKLGNKARCCWLHPCKKASAAVNAIL